ncbi:hypothetical protein [Paraburkholderia xenovorans]|uniref:hypothetical protein n=1 Tax=Paraburkholderia xenovorans TaxID=36873 RepID=UPI0015C55041|nr:hypothetical protein [Paraburkholderia xenovorans]NPT33445.1 hypothetical protein [Paraburkholderia xenovorans]
MSETTIISPLLQIPLTALASALLTSFFQNRDHRYRKHWELKVEAYHDLIGALSGVEEYWEARQREYLRQVDLSAEAESRLDALYAESRPRIRKAELTGAFLFSTGVEAALHEYLKERPREPDWWTYVESELAAIWTCRNAVVGISAKDLELPRSWPGVIWGRVTQWAKPGTRIKTDC